MSRKEYSAARKNTCIAQNHYNVRCLPDPTLAPPS